MGQSALCFLKGRSPNCLQFLRCLCNNVEVNILLFCKCFGQFSFLFDLILLLEFLTYAVITVNTVSCDEGSSFFFLFVSCYSVSGVCFTHCICRSILGVLGPWEFLWRAGSYISCVCDSAVWSGGPVRFYLAFLLERMAGLYGFSFFSGSVVAGTVRFKW
jgi:hypothetical protein